MIILVEPRFLVEMLRDKSKRLAEIFTKRISEIFEISNKLNEKLYEGIYIAISEAIYKFIIHGKPNIIRSKIRLSMQKKTTNFIFSPRIIVSDGINYVFHDIEIGLPLKISFAEDAILYKDIAEDRFLIDDMPKVIAFLDAYSRYLGISVENDNKRIELLTRILLKKQEATLADLILITKKISKKILQSEELKSLPIPLFKNKDLEKSKGLEHSRRSSIGDMELKLKKVTERS